MEDFSTALEMTGMRKIKEDEILSQAQHDVRKDDMLNLILIINV